MIEGYNSRMLQENARLTDANERLLSENESLLGSDSSLVAQNRELTEKNTNKGEAARWKLHEFIKIKPKPLPRSGLWFKTKGTQF